MSLGVEHLWRCRAELNALHRRPAAYRPRCHGVVAPVTSTPIYHLYQLSLPPHTEHQLRHWPFTGRSVAGGAAFTPAISGQTVGDLCTRRTQFLLRQLLKDDRVRSGLPAPQ
jgi:hypothetical protein